MPRAGRYTRPGRAGRAAGAAWDAQDISDYLLEPVRERDTEGEAEEREAERVARPEPVLELPAPALVPLGGSEPGDQYRLFQGRREDDRSGPAR